MHAHDRIHPLNGPWCSCTRARHDPAEGRSHPKDRSSLRTSDPLDGIAPPRDHGARACRSTMGRSAGEFCRAHAFGMLAMTSLALRAAEPPAAPPPTQTPVPLSQIVIEAPEPRFVAPTRRDKVGRIWAPVLINGLGPFRLVLDTGASSSAVNASVAQILGLVPDATHSVLLRGVTGSVAVPTIHVNSFVVGDVIVTPATLPIVTNALGGADGVLGTEGFADKR